MKISFLTYILKLFQKIKNLPSKIHFLDLRDEKFFSDITSKIKSKINSNIVNKIINDVRKNGDRALLKYEKKYSSDRV